jgi:hypothetical protein
VNTPAAKGKADPIARDDVAEPFGDVDELHSGRGAVLPARVVIRT